MADRSDPSALRWLIGNELRQARLASGHTQGAAGKILGCSHSKINYLEIGRNQQHPEEVTELLRFYGAEADHIDRLTSLAGRTDHGTWWAPFSDVVPDWFATFVGLEGLASREFVYETMTVPGLLQTPEYAAGLLSGHLRVPVIDVDRVVNLRIARQDALHAREPLHFVPVIEESVLDREVGGHDIMQAQLHRLLQLSDHPNISVRVMPLSVPVHDGLEGEFILLDFEQAQSIGYIEYPNGAVYVQNQEHVTGYSKVSARLCAAALSPQASYEAIAARLD